MSDDRPSFEESSRRLAAIVAELEGGDLPLERSLALFEEGVKVARAAQAELERAERRVEELLGVDAKGKPILRDLSPTHFPTSATGPTNASPASSRDRGPPPDGRGEG